MIYFDNAATTYPKPPAVIKGIEEYLLNVGASSGRSGHQLGLKAEKIVYSCRKKLAALFNVKDSSRITFALNATEALNTAIFGLLSPEDEVVTTSMEHNSVMRPLRYLEKMKKIKIKILMADEKGFIKKDEIKNKITDNTKLIAVNHVSNIIGTIISLREFKDFKKNALLLLDAAQSAGIYPVDVEQDGIDLLAFTGHKGLMGPTGTGGLYVKEGIDIKPLKLGGTGSVSEQEEQPDFYPDRLEAGTLNTTGIAGLKVSTDFILQKGVPDIYAGEKLLSEYFLEKIGKINKIIIYGPKDPDKILPVFSINLKDRDPSEVAFTLDRKYDIYVRVGLHCAPSAHKTIGTYPEGTVRVSMGYFNKKEEIDSLSDALKSIIRSRKIF